MAPETDDRARRWFGKNDFGPLPYVVLDTAGGADSFTAALVVELPSGLPLTTVIQPHIAECKSGASEMVLLGNAMAKEPIVLGFVLESRRQTQRT